MSIFVPAEPFAPARFIQRELEARDLTQDDLAEMMGMSVRQVANLVSGKSGITGDTAIALGRAFGQNPEFWSKLQAGYELALAKQRDEQKSEEEIAKAKLQAKLITEWPVREVRRRGWIQDSTDASITAEGICRLLRVPNIDEPPPFKVAARKGTDYTKDTSAQLLWYARARQLAEAVPAARYSPSDFDSLYAELRKLAAYPEDVARVPALLGELGIRFVAIQHLAQTKIDGAAFWLDPSSPAVALSLRFDRIDNFWFTLTHELVHIKHHDSDPPIDVDIQAAPGEGEAVSDIEARANREAANYLVPTERLDNFVRRVHPHYYQEKVVKFAQSVGVHPGIVVGLLHGRPNSLKYNQLRKLLAKVRDQIVRGAAMTDGWSNVPDVD